MVKISCSIMSPNFSKRTGVIDTITPHCVDGNLSVKSILSLFLKKERQASCNYAIDSKGQVGVGVEECNMAWTSSSSSNDNRAITCEIANDGDAKTGYHMTDKAIKAFIDLSVDICKRYGFKGVYFDPNKNKPHRNDGTMQITLHRWFKAKACPGDYFVSKIPYIVEQVNKAFVKPVKTSKPVVNTNTYLVTVTTSELNIRANAGTQYDIVGSVKKGDVFTIVDEKNGFLKLKSGSGWISKNYVKRN